MRDLVHVELSIAHEINDTPANRRRECLGKSLEIVRVHDEHCVRHESSLTRSLAQDTMIYRYKQLKIDR
jgi:hypothetical protein